MQNENWYAILTLVLNALTAIGTVGAVIVSLWFAYKLWKREHKFLQLIDFEDSGMAGDYDVSIYSTFNNFCGKDIVVDQAFIFLGDGRNRGMVSEYYEHEEDPRSYTIPAYARNAELSIHQHYGYGTEEERNNRYKEVILQIKKAKSITLTLHTNIGSFDFKINKRNIRQLKNEIN